MRKKHSNQFKLKVALEAIKGTKPMAELCQEFGVANCQIYDWKKQLEMSSEQIFANSHQKTTKDRDQKEIEKCHVTIGKLKVENDFLVKALGH